ncbi:MAG: FHA domain-containing protein [Planctomycetota bacterium]
MEPLVELDKEAFLEQVKEPVVVFDEIGEESREGQFQTINRVPESLGSTAPSPSKSGSDFTLGGASKWACTLSTGSKFACILTLGRAANNNLRINIPSLSKFHAYFTYVAKEKAWYLADANSSNGTFLNGQELPSSHGKVKLDNGALMRFGPDITARYFDPQGLWEQVQKAAPSTQAAEPEAAAADEGE